MDTVTKKIKDSARQTVQMCNLLIDQCNSWENPQTEYEYIEIRKKKSQSVINKIKIQKSA